MDFNTLKNLFDKLALIPPLEWVRFTSLLKFKKIKKGEVYFSQGEHFHGLAYVVSGLIYTYYNLEDGKERCKNFAWKGRFLAPYVSVVRNELANFSAKALEDVWLVEIEYSAFEKLAKGHPCWLQVKVKILDAIIAEREVREYQYLMMNNLQRYEAFKENYADIYEEIPQWMIASFLGITPVALSRLLTQNK